MTSFISQFGHDGQVLHLTFIMRPLVLKPKYPATRDIGPQLTQYAIRSRTATCCPEHAGPARNRNRRWEMVEH